jgi:broad-specificity NMP kinase
VTHPRLALSRLVELVGPPGAGKSTVFHALRARAANVEVAPVLLTREYAPLLATNVAASVGTLVRRGAIRRVTPAQLRLMAYLRALPAAFVRCPPGEGSVLVFDQGPLYSLGRPRLMDGRLASWRREMFEAWASLLDTVVLLDAPDRVLVERIDGRSKWHRLKGQPVEAAIDVISESRTVYEALISNLQAREHGPAILRFDTSGTDPDEIVDALLGAVDGFSLRPSSENAQLDARI